MVDVETSGLNARADRVLQIAITQLSADLTIESTWTTILNPGCDPGPVHIHGLTPARLAGAPQFADIAQHVQASLEGRVLVAHNARFDWAFLSAEAHRTSVELRVRQRLCTMALTRHLDLPTGDLKLGSVARYWGVTQARAHDAADDVATTVAVLQRSLRLAHQLGLSLPLTECATAAAPYPVQSPRTPCHWRYPGQWNSDSNLQQGMKVAITGTTSASRETLIRTATDHGLDVMNNVSSRTSVLVCDQTQRPTTAKFSSAQRHGVPIVDEATFIRLLASVLPGDPKPEARRTAPTPSARTTSRVVEPLPNPSPDLPLHGCRVLVLGGSHEDRALIRKRVSTEGGQGAVNFTASVTHVIGLDGHTADPRWRRALTVGLTILDPETLTVSTSSTPATHEPTPSTANEPPHTVLPRGGVVDIPTGPTWHLSVMWQQVESIEIDVVALVVDDDLQVGGDEDFIFFNQPINPTDSVQLDLSTAGETVVTVDPERLPPTQSRVIIAAALSDDHVFGDIGAVELVLRDESGRVYVRATLDAATEEKTLLLGQLYSRGDRWRFRAEGQGYTDGLAQFAVGHGVDVED